VCCSAPEIQWRWGVGIKSILVVTLTPSNHDELPWQQEAGPSGISPFPETTDYFGDSKQIWMINFRVRDLNAL
jgi:hypothetical protein